MITFVEQPGVVTDLKIKAAYRPVVFDCAPDLIEGNFKFTNVNVTFTQDFIILDTTAITFKVGQEFTISNFSLVANNNKIYHVQSVTVDGSQTKIKVTETYTFQITIQHPLVGPVILPPTGQATIDYQEPSYVTPVLYCDVYFNDVYYKTIAKTIAEYYLDYDYNHPVYRFDVSDAAQEYLSSQLGDINGDGLFVPSQYFCKCFCRIRTSSITIAGFIDPQPPEPVQATSRAPAVAGGGVESYSFYILNATLQHEHHQTLAKHLRAYKISLLNQAFRNPFDWEEGEEDGNDWHEGQEQTWQEDEETSPDADWDEGEEIDPDLYNIYPLTHRPLNYELCQDDSDYFPIATCIGIKKARIIIKRRGGFLETFETDLNQADLNCNII